MVSGRHAWSHLNFSFIAFAAVPSASARISLTHSLRFSKPFIAIVVPALAPVVLSKGVPHRTQAQKIDIITCPKRIAASLSNLPRILAESSGVSKVKKRSGGPRSVRQSFAQLLLERNTDLF